MKAQRLNRHYKKYSSGYQSWDQVQHAEDYLLFDDNIGPYLSIDELSLTQGELYTFLTNKAGRGKRGTLVACCKGTSSKEIIAVLERIPEHKRLKVKEITLDMARNMEAAVKGLFTNAKLVTDRFHVIKLALDAVQHIRVKKRWEEMDIENKAIADAKKAGKKYEQEVLSNGDTPKQLLARCRYILAKKEEQWTLNQKQRAEILFDKYPEIKKAYRLVLSFRAIYENTDLLKAKQKFIEWLNKVRQEKIEEFNTVANTIQYNLENILNFFITRNTNANAESFNSKIKLFRANQRGVVDNKFFLFRLHKLFA